MLNQFFLKSKDEFIYDEYGNWTLKNHYSLNQSSFKWDSTKYKNEYQYDSNGRITSNIGSTWVMASGDWATGSKEEYVYYASGKLIVGIRYKWDISSKKWIGTDKDEYTYDARGNITVYVGSIWDKNFPKWVAYTKDEHTYDDNENMYLYIHYIWIYPGELVVDSKNEYTSDPYGNRTSDIHYHWNSTLSKWVPQEKLENTYNNNYSFDELILPYDAITVLDNVKYQNKILLYKHMLTQSLIYSAVSPWIEYLKYSSYYSPQILTNLLENPKANSIRVFPNPASNYITFNLNEGSNNLELELFNFQGKLVENQIIGNNVLISVQNLKKGFYAFKLIDKGIIYTGKFLIE